MVEEMGGDEDILAELEQLEEEVKMEEAEKEGHVMLPNVPSKPLPSVERPLSERVAVAS